MDNAPFQRWPRMTNRYIEASAPTTISPGTTGVKTSEANLTATATNTTSRAAEAALARQFVLKADRADELRQACAEVLAW
jgi:hypothetical protein